MVSLHALRSLRRAGFAWLAALALLIPAAQSFAGWHAMSHATSDTAAPAGKGHPAGSPACDLCVAAAAIGSCAAPAAMQTTAPVAGTAPLVPAALTGRWISAPAAAYSSRAPPFSFSHC